MDYFDNLDAAIDQIFDCIVNIVYMAENYFWGSIAFGLIVLIMLLSALVTLSGVRKQQKIMMDNIREIKDAIGITDKGSDETNERISYKRSISD